MINEKRGKKEHLLIFIGNEDEVDEDDDEYSRKIEWKIFDLIFHSIIIFKKEQRESQSDPQPKKMLFCIFIFVKQCQSFI